MTWLHCWARNREPMTPRRRNGEANIDKTEDAHKQLNVEIADLDKATEETKDEIAALIKGIKDLDASVAEATENRKEDHEDYVTTMAANNAAIDLLGLAKNRMNKFYNPKMYMAPAKRQLSDDERITVNMGGTLAPTAAPGGIAGTGVTALQTSGAPPPPPATWGAYAEKSEESNGVLTMIDMLVGDLEKEVQEMDVTEKDDQAEYEQMIADSAAKRASDSKSLSDKEGAKADAEAALLKS